MAALKAENVDQYIANASQVTQPILIKLRHIFRTASPELVESIKWGVPCYEYKGPVAGFAAFKNHVTWGLWKAALLDDPDGLIGGKIQRGGKITCVADMTPAAKLRRLIRQAIALNEAGIKPVTPNPELPPDFAAAMSASKSGGKKATDQWNAFTPARKWQYVNWIINAKREETRRNRIETAVQAIREGRTIK